MGDPGSAIAHQAVGRLGRTYLIFAAQNQTSVPENHMTKQTLKNAVLSAGLLGLALSTSTSLAQNGLAPRLSPRHPASTAAQAASHPTTTTGSPSYTYTLLSYPGTLTTFANGMNLGATTSEIEIAGGYGAAPILNQGGFLARVSGTETVTETYKAVNDPHAPGDLQLAADVNDSGQIVGFFADSSDNDHGYEVSDGRFTAINFPGSTSTFAQGINDSGEVVGFWGTSTAYGGSFTLIGGTYASFNYSGAAPGQTFALGVNSGGEISGWYNDTSGVSHGFLLSGGTYTSIDPPGSVGTIAIGINDAGDIVGSYCTTSECNSTGEGEQGFVLSNGVFTTIAIPGEFYTSVSGINNNGVLIGNYQDAAGLVVSFLASPSTP